MLSIYIVEVTVEQFQIMWDHELCELKQPWTAEDVELRALHDARNFLLNGSPDLHDWNFPGGQQVAILQKQLEHRIRAAHRTRANPCCTCSRLRKMYLE